MGGLDSANHLPAVLEALSRSHIANRIEVTVAISSSAPHLESLRRICGTQKFVTDLCVDTNSMATIMCNSDFAISAGGITAYELACLGVPMLLLPLSDIQAKLAHNISQKAIAWTVEPWRHEPLSRIPAALMRIWTALSDSTRHEVPPIVDGLGTQRVVAALLGFESQT
jgi:spore coat polysaccharide biosynthesis predicted glycosyltransferase SpsG